MATAAEVEVDTLADRLREEVVAADATVVPPPLVGAWAGSRRRDRHRVLALLAVALTAEGAASGRCGMVPVAAPTPRGHARMDWTLEVVILPVSDIDRSVAFYRDQVGFELDHDTRNEQMHVVQLTPRGSGCSIVFGDLPPQREMAPGSLKGLQLVVADAAAARAELVGRGVEASEPVSFGDQDGATFFGFADPDGNTWAVQELKVRADKPLIPPEARGRFGA